MPKTQEIIATLHSLANDYFVVAIAWHIVIYLLLAFLVSKWSPSNKLLSSLLCLPLLSVAIFSWLGGNPFNGSLFSIMAVLVFIFGLKTSSVPVTVSQIPYLIIGILMIAFGMAYPHFLDTGTFIKYLYASPVGLVPCPTLSVLIGFMLLFNAFNSNSLSVIFIISGLFYGAFGVLKLGVILDIGLLFGTLTLLVKYILTLKSNAG